MPCADLVLAARVRVVTTTAASGFGCGSWAFVQKSNKSPLVPKKNHESLVRLTSWVMSVPALRLCCGCTEDRMSKPLSYRGARGLSMELHAGARRSRV